MVLVKSIYYTEEFLLQLSAAYPQNLASPFPGCPHAPAVALYARSEVVTLLTMKTLSSGIRKYGLTPGPCYHHVLPWSRQQVSHPRTTLLELLCNLNSLRSLSMFNSEMYVTCRMHDKQEKQKHNSGWKTGGKRPLWRPRHRQDSTTIHLA